MFQIYDLETVIKNKKSLPLVWEGWRIEGREGEKEREVGKKIKDKT